VTDNSGGSVVPGQGVTYTIVVSNSGPSTATGVSVSDLLPAGATNVSWSGNGQAGAGDLSDVIASLAPGATVTYTVTAVIDPSATGALDNTVTVGAANDSNLSNNSATDSDALAPQNDVGVSMTDNSGGSVVPGQGVTYTIVVSNSGPSTATGVAVSDPLPAGATNVSWSGNGQAGTGDLSDVIASLAPGASVTYTVTAIIDPSARGVLSNTVTVTAANDTDASNNIVTGTVHLTPHNDVSVTTTDGGSGATATVSRVPPSTLSVSDSPVLPAQVIPVYQGFLPGNPGAMPILSPVPLPSQPSLTALVGGAGEDQTGLAWLSGFVYLDHNNDGLRGGAEPGIPNVVLVLTGNTDRGQPITRTTVTGEDGFYIFENLPAGNYTVREMQPEGFLDGKVAVGWVNGRLSGDLAATDTIARIALPRAGEGSEYNFGELLPASISGSVHLDDNLNFGWDEGEVGLAGVVVRLTGRDDRGGNVDQITTTDEEGNYTFTNLRPGNYTVTVGPEDGLESVQAQVGTLGGSAESMESVTGINVRSGMHGTRYDFARVSSEVSSPVQGGAEQGGEMREEDASDDLSPVGETDAFFAQAGEDLAGQLGGWGGMAALSLVAATTVLTVLERRKESNRDTAFASRWR
jgi:uncharacterized repeat protein (TIGR01451 family)